MPIQANGKKCIKSRSKCSGVINRAAEGNERDDCGTIFCIQILRNNFRPLHMPAVAFYIVLATTKKKTWNVNSFFVVFSTSKVRSAWHACDVTRNLNAIKRHTDDHCHVYGAHVVHTTFLNVFMRFHNTTLWFAFRFSRGNPTLDRHRMSHARNSHSIHTQFLSSSSSTSFVYDHQRAQRAIGTCSVAGDK